MRVQKVEVIGFRGLVKEEYRLDDLTVFHGGMGTGKTSKLIAALYAFTASPPVGLTADDLININSEFMWVKVTGMTDGKPFSIERRKKRGQAAVSKVEGGPIPTFGEGLYIEGREIARLFAGAPTEKMFKIDALLGLTAYTEAVREISTVAFERQIDELSSLKANASRIKELREKTLEAEAELKEVKRKLQETSDRLEMDRQLFEWAKKLKGKLEEWRRRAAQAEERQRLIREYKAQLDSIPKHGEGLESELIEFESRYGAMQRRITFLESAMQTLDLEEKKVEEMKNCPLCGAPISPNSLSRFQHYGEEYREYAARSVELEDLLAEKRRMVQKARADEGRISFLEEQIRKLEVDVASASAELPSAEETARMEELLKVKEVLDRDQGLLEVERRSLEEQLGAFIAVEPRVRGTVPEDVDEKIRMLSNLKSRVQRVRTVLADVLDEVRKEQLDRLRNDFRTTFQRIYPYQQFKQVDFETILVRGKEVLVAKGEVDGAWIDSKQMSTGENVAIGFALLFAVNQLGGAPVLLLDEPEEGLDSEGLKGLADTLHRLKETTQIVVATRSREFAQLLQSSKIEGQA